MDQPGTALLEASAARARTALWVVFAVNGAVLGTWASRIPAVKDAADLSTGGLGLVLLAPAVGALAAFELAGRACARWGSARVTALVTAGFCLVLPLVGLADTSPVALFGALLLFGALNGSVDVSMNTHGVTVEQALGRPALSRMHAAWAAGGLLGAATGALAAGADLGVRLHFLLAAAVVLLAAVVAGRRLALPHPPPAGHATEASEVRRGVRRALPGPVLLLGVVGFCALLAEGSAADWSATYLRQSVGTSAAVAAAAYAAFTGAMLLTRLCGDALRTRFAGERLLPASAALATVGLLLGLAVGTPAAGVAGFALLGAGLAVVVPIVFAVAGQLDARRTGLPPATSLARVNTLSYLGFLAGPPLVGAVAQLTGLRAALLVPALLTAAIVPLSRLALRTAA